MIDRLRIQGFKSFVDVDLDLGSVNVFIGANGSGKSNLLEALGVLGASAFGTVEPETLRYRGVRLGVTSSYKSSFKDQPSKRLRLGARSKSARYMVAFENLLLSDKLKWRYESERLSNNEVQLLTRDRAYCELYSEAQGSQPVTLASDQSAASLAVRIQANDVSPARMLLESLERFAIFAPTTPSLRGLVDDITREPLGLGGSGLPRAVRDLISEKSGTFGPFDLDELWDVIDWAEGMRIVPSSKAPVSPSIKTGPEVLTFLDRFKRKKHRSISAYDASEGALYVLFMLALVAHPDAPPIFAVDNFDQALHPRVACVLTKMICDELARSNGRQLLATTHNPLVLDGLDLRNDRIRLFAVDRDRSGVSQVRRVVVTEELMNQAEDGLSLSRLWLMGRLGGVPQAL